MAGRASGRQCRAEISRRRRTSSSEGTSLLVSARVSVRTAAVVAMPPIAPVCKPPASVQQTPPSACRLAPRWPKIEYGNRCGRTRLIAWPRRSRLSGAFAFSFSAIAYLLAQAHGENKSATACRRFRLAYATSFTEGVTVDASLRKLPASIQQAAAPNPPLREPSCSGSTVCWLTTRTIGSHSPRPAR